MLSFFAMLPSSIYRGGSTSKVALVTMLIGLLFASETLARPLTDSCSCVEDPNFEILRPKKDGTIRNCAWLANGSKKRQDRICTKLETQNKPTCPITCNTCDSCDCADLVDGGDCSSFKPGLSCDDNYKYINGCGSTDSITCAPIDTYTCDNGTWTKSSFVNLPCAGDIFSPSGEECDPAACPFNAPRESNCDAAQVGLDCPYNYQYFGCNFQDGYSCTATDHYYCSEEQTWEHAMLVPVPCVDPDPGSPAGQTCEPCPTEPAEDCPLRQPTLGRECYIDSRIECQYNFDITGCTADELQCTAADRYVCNNGRWDKIVTIPEQPCPPTNKPCPKEKPPMGGLCRMFGYDVGLQCNYEYRNLSCEDDEVKCFATEFYTCSETGWIVAMPGLRPCPNDDYPPTYYEECIP